MQIIPAPNGVYHKETGVFSPPKKLGVALGGFEESCLAAFSQRTGIACDAAAKQKDLTLRKDESLAAEEYRLWVTPAGIEVAASGRAGAIWALTTLSQSRDEAGAFACMELHDRPRYRHRGQHFDCCRHFFDIEQVKSVIEQISLVKMNVLHWHLSDDQGWRIESKAFPQLHKTEGQPYFTQKEIREVVAYAAERGVDVVPEIDLPGHTLAMIAAMPELSCTGEKVQLATTGGIFDDILCPGKDHTIDVVLKVLDEVSALFPSRYFHIGGDEAPKTRWKECPDCNARIEALGLAGYEELQGWFTQRLVEHLREKGKIAVGWNDILFAQNAPRDVVIQNWLDYGPDAGLEPFFDKGGQMVFSDMFHLYFDYPYSMSPLKRVYHFTPFIGKRDCSADANTEGIESCLWTERIETAERLQKQLYPRVFAVAEAGWTVRRDYVGFKERLKGKFAQLDAAGIAYTPPDQYDPKGKARRAQTVDYVARLQATAQPRKEGEKSHIEFSWAGARRLLKYFIKIQDVPAVLKQVKKGQVL